MEKGQSIRKREYIIFIKAKGHNKWYVDTKCSDGKVAKKWAQRLEEKGHVDVEVREVITIETITYKTEEHE